MLSLTGEIRRDDGCLDYSAGITGDNKDDKVIVSSCHGQKGNQHWIYNEVCINESRVFDIRLTTFNRMLTKFYDKIAYDLSSFFSRTINYIIQHQIYV
jgi:hypothetical protein